ncbi:hypothetical protein SORBI_3003G075566 [Sorghum bicolor]|uniref:Uncharacterized protein n=1 Tax=Sorghum bicolor TaxID=4558 RepID=A0A1W0VW17_SORBI|nr:hypothetical protein SORBI_3003G075566 [Sorghum bicolor]
MEAGNSFMGLKILWASFHAKVDHEGAGMWALRSFLELRLTDYYRWSAQNDLIKWLGYNIYRIFFFLDGVSFLFKLNKVLIFVTKQYYHYSKIKKKEIKMGSIIYSKCIKHHTNKGTA